LRLFSFRGYGLTLAALALTVFGAIECPPPSKSGLKHCCLVSCSTFGWLSEDKSQGDVKELIEHMTDGGRVQESHVNVRRNNSQTYRKNDFFPTNITIFFLHKSVTCENGTFAFKTTP